MNLGTVNQCDENIIGIECSEMHYLMALHGVGLVGEMIFLLLDHPVCGQGQIQLLLAGLIQY